MVVSIKFQVPSGTSLRSLVTGFVLTQRTDGKSPTTVEYYEGNLKRFLWYADTKGWPAMPASLLSGTFESSWAMSLSP